MKIRVAVVVLLTCVTAVARRRLQSGVVAGWRLDRVHLRTHGSADLYRMKPDGTGVERLTDSPAYDDQAAFSGDGQQVVFVTTRVNGTADLWTLDVRTHQAKALTSGSGGDYRPRGRRMARGLRLRRSEARVFPFHTNAGKHCSAPKFIWCTRTDQACAS